MATRRRLVAVAWTALSSLAIYLLAMLATRDSILAGLLVAGNCAINLTAPILEQVQGGPGFAPANPARVAPPAGFGPAEPGGSREVRQRTPPGASPSK